jgi:hypothetical protein
MYGFNIFCPLRVGGSMRMKMFFLILENVKEASFCHKLTYKFDDTKNSKNTFFDYIIKNYSGGEEE